VDASPDDELIVRSRDERMGAALPKEGFLRRPVEGFLDNHSAFIAVGRVGVVVNNRVGDGGVGESTDLPARGDFGIGLLGGDNAVG
jgi:hypothetical protein